MIEIRVTQIQKGEDMGLWIWKIKKGSNWFLRSYKTYVDAWLANNSALKIKEFLESNDFKNIAIFTGEYNIPKTHRKFYEKRTEAINRVVNGEVNEEVSIDSSFEKFGFKVVKIEEE